MLPYYINSAFGRQSSDSSVICIKKCMFSSKNVCCSFLQIPKLVNSVCSESVMDMRCLANSDDNYRQTLQRFI